MGPMRRAPPSSFADYCLLITLITHPFPILGRGNTNQANKRSPQGIWVSESALPGYLFRNGFARLQQTAGGCYSRFVYPGGGGDSYLFLKQSRKMAGHLPP